MSQPVLVPVVFRSTENGIEVLMRQSDGPVHFPTFVPDPEMNPLIAAKQAVEPMASITKVGKPERLGLLPIGDPEVWEVVLIPLTSRSQATLTDGMVWQSMGADSSGWAAPSRSLHEVLRGCASDLERLAAVEAP